MSDDNDSGIKKDIPLILMMNISAGIVMNDEGKLSFHLLDPSGGVLGSGLFNDETYNVIEGQMSEALNHIGLELPSSIDEIGWDFMCSGCGNIITVPYEMLEFNFIKSKSVDNFKHEDFHYIMFWVDLLNIMVSCCGMVNYDYCDK